jgi:hypothetical protein
MTRMPESLSSNGDSIETINCLPHGRTPNWKYQQENYLVITAVRFQIIVFYQETRIILLSNSGYFCATRVNIQQFYLLPTHCIYVFCTDLRTNSDYFPIQH